MRQVIEIKYTSPTGHKMSFRCNSEERAAEFVSNMEKRGYAIKSKSIVRARKNEAAMGEQVVGIDY